MEQTPPLLKPTKRQNSISLNFPIVGIGASSGGLETLEQFFANMPKDTGMAFVIIQHLDPTHIGIMSELLQRITVMKVTQVTDRLQVKPNHVYVIPPNKSMSILNGYLHLFKPAEFKGTIIIVFADVPALPTPVIIKSKTGKQTLSSRKHESDSDLQRTLEELECTREEMQTSQEELKSTNEELRSTNEELQSANQELTISKEEMQSLNEALQAVNMELQSKVAELMEANSDIKNVLNSTDIATLLLDNELNIRRYTDQLTKLIKLRPSDIGRLFTEMVSDLQYPEIADHAREVLRTLIFKESNISTSDQRWFTVRIMPYRTLDNRINGVAITFIDITVAKKLEAELKETISIFREHNLYKP